MNDENMEHPVPKSSVSINIIKGKLKAKGMNYVETGDTCTVVITGHLVSTADNENTISFSICPESIRFREPKSDDDEDTESDHPGTESLGGEMKKMTQKRTWRPGRE